VPWAKRDCDLVGFSSGEGGFKSHSPEIPLCYNGVGLFGPLVREGRCFMLPKRMLGSE